jgi:hypothetical protein
MIVHIAGSYCRVISPGRISELAKHHIAGSGTLALYCQVGYLAKTFLGPVPIQESSGHKQNTKTQTMASLSRPACALCGTESFQVPLWQLACLHCVCQDCEDTRELSDQEECLVCCKPALPAAQNHALFELAKALGKGDYSGAGETDVDCVLPSSPKKARVEVNGGQLSTIWSARIEALEQAKAGVERDLAAKQAVLQAEYDAMLTRFQDESARYLHLLKSGFNVHKAELNIAARASCKDLSIQISSAEAHIPNWSHVVRDGQDAGAVVSLPAPLPLPSLHDDMRPVVDSWSDPVPQQYMISTTRTLYCGKAIHDKDGCLLFPVYKVYKDKDSARRELLEMMVASIWEEKYLVDVGSGYGYAVSPFTVLDKLKSVCHPGQLDVVVPMIAALQVFSDFYFFNDISWGVMMPISTSVTVVPGFCDKTILSDDFKAAILDLLPKTGVPNAGPADLGRCICCV